MNITRIPAEDVPLTSRWLSRWLTPRPMHSSHVDELHLSTLFRKRSNDLNVPTGHKCGSDSVRYMEDLAGRSSDPKECNNWLGSILIEMTAYLLGHSETYATIVDKRTGDEWRVEITSRMTTDMTRLAKRWIKQELGSECYLEGGKVGPSIVGDYSIKIRTDNRPPDSLVVWSSGGFYVGVREH